MKNFLKILEIILLPLIAIAAVVIATLITSFPSKTVSYTFWIILISQICTILGLLFFSYLFGFGSIKDWIKFVQELQVLKREDVQKSLSELKELSKVTKTLWEKHGLGILDDYSDHLVNRQKQNKTAWVLGASLRPTAHNPSILIEDLKNEMIYQFLCDGYNIDLIKSRAKQITKTLCDENPIYVRKKAIRISYMKPSPVNLPMTIYNAEKEDTEVIFFPYEIEGAIHKKCAILLKNKEAVQMLKEKFDMLWEQCLGNELDLMKLVEEV